MGLLQYLGATALYLIGIGVIILGVLILVFSPAMALSGANIGVAMFVASVFIIIGIFIIATAKYYSKKA
jgi:hypothetical protein